MVNERQFLLFTIYHLPFTIFMDILWSPWRYDYIKSGDAPKAVDSSGCVFCDILNNSATDEENFILRRAEFNFVILNIYPYISGHLMIVPYAHLADLDQADKLTTDEMMDLAKHCQSALREVYRPNGFNLGMNFGRAGGAGVAEHFHMHILPRWIGDVNFMTSIGETRTIPEDLKITYNKLKGKI
ncbi:MAG: HIT domain-containing protein [Acidobacteriota bacterium]|nr:HIT domain-containing protein [Acidobacteriota bacterium]